MKKIILKLKEILIVFGATFVIAPLAIADTAGGFFIEPSITYEVGDTAGDYPSPLSDSSGEITGLGLGARLGFHLEEAFFLGADLRYSMPQFKDSAVDYDAKAVATNWGPVIGMQMPDLGLRIWGTYVMGGDLNPEKSDGLDIKFQNATGYRIGAGFRITSFSINLEYQDLKYGAAKIESLGPLALNTSFDDIDYQNKTWLLSASFPLEL